jgi:transcriptional regulator with XRE-family HTH domain
MTAEEFKQIRQALKLRGHEIAKKLGVSINEAWEYEKGKKTIPDKIEKYLRSIDPRRSS